MPCDSFYGACRVGCGQFGSPFDWSCLIFLALFNLKQEDLRLAFVEKKGIRNIQKGESELASLTIRYSVKQPPFSICRRPKHNQSSERYQKGPLSKKRTKIAFCSSHDQQSKGAS